MGKRMFQIAAVCFICNMLVEGCTSIFHSDLLLRNSVQILILSRKEWGYIGTIRSNIKICPLILMRNLYILTYLIEI